MDNQKLALYVALSVVLFLLWQAWQKDYGTPQLPHAEHAVSVPIAASNKPNADVPLPPALPQQALTPPAQPQLKSAERIRVITDLLQVEIDAAGGDIRQIDLSAYPVSAEQPDQPFRLLSDAPERLFVAQNGLLGNNAPNHYTIYQIAQTEYRLAEGAASIEVPLLWRDPSGIEISKIYTFYRNSYVVQLNYQIRNSSLSEWRGQMYAQLQRLEPPQKSSLFGVYTYTGAVVSSPENVYEKVDFSWMKKENLAREFKNGWVAMIEHYFSTAIIPPHDVVINAYTKNLDGGRYVIGYLGPTLIVPPQENQTVSTRFYFGPKEPVRLKETATNLELTVDYGKLTLIAQPIYWLLERIYHLVGNWGWAIIFLTIIIKAAFFNLSATSYKSMAQMRKLTPRIQALKERYGDDKVRMNEAMMEIYRKEKINPLGGCLPILVQIPVFIALYWVLVESVELRQAPWLLWIKDLSAQDPYYVLPLILGVTMFIQQQLSPPPPDPIQAKVMMGMPILFSVMFLFFPAGLVLYWLVNNTLSIAQQWYITNKIVTD